MCSSLDGTADNAVSGTASAAGSVKNDDLVRNMSVLMARNKIPYSSSVQGSSDNAPGQRSNNQPDDMIKISGKASALFDAKDPTAPTISKPFGKTNMALNILENRRKLDLDSAAAVDTKTGPQDTPATDAPAYRLSTSVLIELLRATRQDPEKFKNVKDLNEKLNISHLKDSEESTEIMRHYFNVPELSIRENEDGSINGHWVDDIYDFNKQRAKNI